MKKLFALTIGLILLASPVFSADGDITKAEVKPDVVKYELDSVVLRAITKQAIITYRKVDSNGDPVGDEINVIFQNTPDDPATPEDEENNEFTQLINLINNNSNIKTSITTAVRTKLGL